MPDRLGQDTWKLLNVSQEGVQFHLEWLKTNKDAFPFPPQGWYGREGWTLYAGFRVKVPWHPDNLPENKGGGWTYHRLDYAIVQRTSP
jgi:hypothetical protein